MVVEGIAFSHEARRKETAVWVEIIGCLIQNT